MAVTRMTTPLKAGDGRLKVLWLDDTIDRIAPWSGAALDFEPWFSLVYATHPDDIRKLIEDSASPCTRSDGGQPLYDLGDAPFDAYLVDFRLCDKIDDGCMKEDHLEAGLHAPSAGLLVGILAALRWPAHPQALIPYSGYDEEFGQIWRLTQQFCPPAISVLWDDSITKGTRDQESLLKLLPVQFRRALSSAARSADVVMPLRERDRLETLLEGVDGGTVAADELVWLSTTCGLRPFLVGALFHDVLDQVNRTVPAAEIRKWISTFPVADAITRQARRLAEFYWRLKCNEVSRDIYSIMRSLRQGADLPGLPSHPPSYPWLCSWKRKGEGRDESVQLIRLAVLCLYLRQHDDRVRRRRQQADIPDDVRNLLLVLRDDERSIEELLGDLENAARMDGCLDRYHELIASFLEFVESGAVVDPIRNVIADREIDVDEYDIVRLVDPFPAAWDGPLSLDESMKVGKGLTRLNMDGVPTLDVKGLLSGDASSLTPAELLCARRYARELMPSDEDWPDWLRFGEQALEG
jgi:hypothetical protein